MPFVPELLADLRELGSDADQIAQVLSELELPHTASVVDLGCGKGAVAVHIAETLRFHVVGVELFEPFVHECQRFAHERGVSDLCTFLHGDVAQLAGRIGPFDAAVFAALGDVLGPLEDTIRIVRQYVRPSGYIVLSDVFIADGGDANFRGFENYASHEETLRRLTSCGDVLVREFRASPDAEDGDVPDEAALILARALAIAERHPESREALLGFAASQANQNAYADANLVDAVWVLRRS